MSERYQDGPDTRTWHFFEMATYLLGITALGVLGAFVFQDVQRNLEKAPPSFELPVENVLIFLFVLFVVVALVDRMHDTRLDAINDRAIRRYERSRGR